MESRAVFFRGKKLGDFLPPTTFYGNQKQPFSRGRLTPHVAPLLSQFQGAAGADDGVPVMELSATTSGDFQILGGLGYQ